MKKFNYLLFICFIFLIGFNVKAEENMGTYIFRSSLDSNKVVSVNNNNVDLETYRNLDTQKWDLFKESDYYYIKSHANNNMVIDVFSALNSNGTNIQTYVLNRTNAQKWRINGTNNSMFFVTSLIGNKNMDITSANSSDGTNIQLYQNNGTNAQRYYLERISNLDSDLKDGNYIIRNLNNRNNAIDLLNANTANGSNIQVYSNNLNWAQVWNVKKASDGYYRITSYLNGNKSLDISAGIMQNSNNIQLYDYNGTNAQKFIIDKNSDGSYTIRNISGIKVIDVSGGSSLPASNIQLYDSNNTYAQRFIFERSEPVTDLNGSYFIESSKDQNKVIGLSNPITFNGNNVALRNKAEDNYDRWKISRTSRDQYKIMSGVSNKAMDVNGNGLRNGSNVQIYSDNGTGAQRWVIRKNDNDTYSFYGLNSIRALDLTSGSTNEWTNVQIYDSNNSYAQQFYLSNTKLDSYSQNYKNGSYMIKTTNSNYTIDIAGANKASNTNVQIYQQNNSMAQYFKLEYLSNGEYIFRSYINPDLVLTLNGNNIVSSRYNGSDSQKFYIFDLGNNKVNILSKVNGLSLSYNSISNGSNLGTNYSNKSFVIEKANPYVLYGGVDLSRHQGYVDFNSLKNNVDFAILRIGYGKDIPSQDDDRFFEYARGCNQYNIPFAVYLYSYATNIWEADSEANHAIRLLNSAKAQGLIPNMKVQAFFDTEESGTEGVARDNAIRFCSKLKQNGYTCGIYGGKNWLINYIRPNDLYTKYPIWVAHYKFTPPNMSYSYAASNKTNYNASPYYLWQYQSDGRLPGVNTNVDMNIGYNIFD